MNWKTWWAIARRQMRYKHLLTERLAAWSPERIDACADPGELAAVIALSERIEKHQARMDRHNDTMPLVGKLN